MGFIIGLFIGCAVGVTVMCCLFVAKREVNYERT